MRNPAVVALIAVIAAAGVVACFLVASDRRSPVAGATASEVRTSEPTAPRRERRPRPRAIERRPAAAEAPGPPSESTQAWEDAARVEWRAARRLAPLLAERDTTNQALHEVGALATDDLLMARIERAFNDYVATSGADRQRALTVMDASIHELEPIIQQKVDVGVLAESEAKSIVKAVEALRGSVEWYGSEFPLDASRGPPAGGVGEKAGETDADTTRAAGDRTALTKLIRETRRQGLREELANLDKIIAAEPARVALWDQGVAPIRRVVVRAQLGEIDYAEARRQADQLLEGLEVDANSWNRVSSLADLIDWYGGPVVRKLYGD